MNANSDKEYIDTKVGDLRGYMDARFEIVEAKMDVLRLEFGEKLERAISHIVKWMVGLFVATISVFIAIVSMGVNLVLRELPPAVPAQAPARVVSTPAVVIQLTPQGATVTPAAPAGKP